MPEPAIFWHSSVMQAAPVRILIALAVTMLLLAVACSSSTPQAQQQAASPTPDPPATVLAQPPATPTATAVPASVTPTPLPIPTPVSTDDLIEAQPMRSGSICEASPLPGVEEPTVNPSFVVPASMWTSDCHVLEFVGTDLEVCCGSPLMISTRTDPVTAVLSKAGTGEDATLVNAEWTIVDTRSAWILESRYTSHDRQEPWTVRQLVVDLPTGTLVVTASDLRSDIDSARTWAAFEELAASVGVRQPRDERLAGWTAPPDRWCAGSTWVIEVPATWFAHDFCDGTSDSVILNTTDVPAQCACFGPLWIEPGWVEDDDTMTVLSDISTTRADGALVRIVDAIRQDDATGPLELRGVIVNLGHTSVTVVANRMPDYAGPLHGWSDTLDAQQLIANSLREWRDPICSNPTPNIVQTTTATALRATSDSDAAIATIPQGTALAATGCTAADPDGRTWHEVQTMPVVDTTTAVQPRSERGGNYVGWIAGDSFDSVAAADCPARADDFDPSEWEIAARGDFDGDGAADRALLRGAEFPPDSNLREDGRAAQPPAEVAFLFADGSATIGPLDEDAGARLFSVTRLIEVTRPVGLGRDVLYVADPQQRGAYTSSIFIVGVDECTPVVHGRVMWGASVGNQLSYCRAPTPFGTVLRSLHTTANVHGVLAAASDEHLVWADGAMQPLDGFGVGTEPLCGGFFNPAGAPYNDYVGEPGPLHGVHGLSLQWIGTDSAEWGEIEFTTIGPDRYRVDGRQGAGLGEDGDFLSIGGFVQQLPNGDLRFEGIINSRVSFLNDGETCYRGSKQTLRSTEGRAYWRMQDQLNCDFISSDYIDIYL